MLRRFSVIVASAAMLALSAMPAFATTSTHKLHFPTLPGVQAWGTYKKVGNGVRLTICTKDNANYFATGAVALASNSSGTRVANFGAVALGPGTTQCRSGVVHLTAHLRIFTFIAGNNGRITQKSAIRKVY